MSGQPEVPAGDFASDNHAGVDPAVLEAMAAANAGHAPSYGADPWTERLERLFRRHFGEQARGFCLFNGTGANVAAIDAVTRPWEGVVCTEVAHIHVDECGAPERLAQTKLLAVEAPLGKVEPEQLSRWEADRGDEHRVQPRLVSITQATEVGTVYTLDETRTLVEAAHELGMLVHVDGARLANAAASLRVSLGELTTDAGVDVVSFGGTKNGLLVGDAVVFCGSRAEELAHHFAFTRKQLGQLASKMRFLAAGFAALLEDERWLRNARHANEMATRLERAVRGIDGVEIAYPVEANAVFARLRRPAIDALLESAPGEHPFYVTDPAADEVRWMCAWDTTPEQVDSFAAEVARAVERGA